MVNANLAQVLWQSSLQDYVRAIAWLPASSKKEQDNDNTSILAAASAAGEVVVWQGQDLISLRSADGQWISCLEFSADGQYLAAGGQDRQVKIWRVADLDLTADADTAKINQPTYVINNNDAWIEHLAWSPDADLLAFSQGSKIILWQISAQKQMAELDFKASSIFDLAWHPGGMYLAASGHGGVKVWSSQNWQEPDYVLQVPGASLSCAWTADGAYLASGNLDRTLSVLKWQSPPPWLMQGFPGKVQHLAWSMVNPPTKPPMIAAACIDGITIWQQHDPSAAWQSQVLEKHEGFVQAIAFQPHTNHLASTATDGDVYLWQNAQKSRQLYTGLKDGCACLAWEHQGQRLAIGGRSGELIVLSLLNRELEPGQDKGKLKRTKRGFA
ncbi:WD-40 repeat-containing protein [Thalassoporum mexicanum PCC 7367]|uniref:WD40 repeat domain-containing protein n=1 Tax=Thalassoporum mexicanum TaxID=3457544 RepID=UPI00029FBB24|nr:WD-40 repeat-containing protein [Pseudanabaena sp. PCC 7367]AFY70978.1 WD-40 repeat-containing protein [Pseudanabaena sp. PCC 7367]